MGMYYIYLPQFQYIPTENKLCVLSLNCPMSQITIVQLLYYNENASYCEDV